MDANVLIIEQGLVLMVAGMSIVFVFLYVLVLVMQLTGRVVPRFNHLLPDIVPKSSPPPAAAVRDDAVIAVAIAVAVARSR